MCRSPRMSPSSISSGSSPLRAAARARRGSRAARAGCTACRAARRPPPRWRRRCVSPLASSAMPYSLTWSPRLTAAVRSASLCLPEPVKCWSRLPKASSGTMRRSTGRPVVGQRPRAGRAGGLHHVDQRQRAERLDERRPGRSRRRRCRGPCTSSAQRRALPASSTPIAAGCSRRRADQLLADRERLREQHARPWARRRRRRRAPPARSPRPWRRSPGTSREPVLLGRLAQVVERRRRRGARRAAARASGPRPGMRVTSTRPGGILRLQLVGGRDRAGLEQRVDLLGDRLAHARRAPPRVPARAISSTETPASRIAFAALR